MSMEMDNFSIKKAAIDDCEVIADLSSGLNRSQGMTEWHRPDVRVLQDNFEQVDIYLAESGGKAVGFVAGFKHFNPHNSYSRYIVSSIFVVKEHRRQGIGKALLSRLMQDKKDDGIRQFAIDVMPDSKEACALYESLGFGRKDPAFVNYRLGFDELDAFYSRRTHA